MVALVALVAWGCGINVYNGPGFDDGGEPTGQQGTGGAADCTGYEDAAGTNPIALRVANATSQSIFLVSADCLSEVFPRLARDDGGSLTYLGGGPCGATCETLQEFAPVCVDQACPPPSVIRVDPGRSYVLGAWPGTYLRPTTMPLGCHAAPEYSEGGACLQRTAAEAAPYLMQVDVFTEVTCDNCLCDASATGFCVMPPEAEVVGSPGTYGVLFDYPSSRELVVTVQ